MSADRIPSTRTAARPPAPAPAQVPQYAYGWLVYVVGALVAIAMAFAIYKLNYTFGQAPHRIVKILVAFALLSLVILRPRIALYAWLLSLPVTGWLPVTGIPGLNGINVLFLVLLIAWIVPAVMRKERVLANTELRWPVAAYLAVLATASLRSAFFPIDPYQQGTLPILMSIWQRLPAIAVYFVVANAELSERQIRNLLAGIAVAAGIMGIISLRQFASIRAGRRITGGMNSNELGAYFSVCATMLLSQVFWSRVFRPFQRVVMWVGAAFATIGVLLPKSRGAYVSFAASMTALTYLTSKKALIVFLLLLATSPVWAPGFVKDRMAETTVDSVEAALVGDVGDRLDPSAAVRLEVWAVVVHAFVRSPIIGYGYGAVPILTADKLSRPFSAHNLYFETLGESGLVGLGVLAWLLWACLKSGRTLLSLADRPLFRGLAVGFLAVTVAVIVANVFGQRFAHRAITGTYFFIAGLVDRSIVLRRRETALEA
jgi:O-antigen ligase